MTSYWENDIRYRMWADQAKAGIDSLRDERDAAVERAERAEEMWAERSRLLGEETLSHGVTLARLNALIEAVEIFGKHYPDYKPFWVLALAAAKGGK